MKISRTLACAGILTASLAGAPACAATLVTYVSGKGVDTGGCNPANPCRSFAYALTQTLPGGQIKAIDAAGYGPVTITQAVSLLGVQGSGISAISGNHITINAGLNDAVTIANLTLDGGATAIDGILLNSGATLTIRNCLIQNFSQSGVHIQPSQSTNILISDSVSTASKYGFSGALDGGPTIVMERVLAQSNSVAGAAFVASSPNGNSAVIVANSNFSRNTGPGIQIPQNVTLQITQSTVSQNGGFGIDCAGNCGSAGNNFFAGNASGDVNGTLATVGTK